MSIKDNKKNKGLLNSFKDKRVRYGGFAALISVLMILVLVILNLFVSWLPWGLDITSQKYFSLSDVSKQVLSTLDDDVNIYAMYEGGSENTSVIGILERYVSENSKVSLKTIDPVQNPTFAAKYSNEDGSYVATGSIVIACGDKYRVIGSDSITYEGTDYEGNSTGYFLDVEQLITSAINYVTSEKTPMVYVLTGHDEAGLPEYLTSYLIKNNYDVQELKLLTTMKVPDDANMVIISGGTQDWAVEECQVLTDYMNKGGRIIYFYDVYSMMSLDKPNIESFLKSYGVALIDGVIAEGSSSNIYYQNPYYLIPQLQEHEITTPIADENLNAVIPISAGISILDTKRRELTIEPFLVTSSNSWLKPNGATVTTEKEEGDIDGPFNLAVAIEDQIDDSTTGRMIVYGSIDLLGESFYSLSGNTDLFMNTVGWMYENTNTISIVAKSLSVSNLNMTALDVWIWFAVTAIIVPIGVLAGGLVVFLKRRNL